MHTSFQRDYGRAPRGVPVEDVKRGNAFERLNIIGAVCEQEHFAIQCYKHTTTGDFFESWFEHSLLPHIPPGEGYTVVLDNASFHRKKRLKKLARGKVRLLFLPPYSPDYSRIEKSWANLKRFLHSNLRDYLSLESAIYDYFIPSYF